MLLTDYRRERRLRLREIADMLGCSTAMVSYVLAGKRRLSWDAASRLAVATNGEVSLLEAKYPDGHVPDDIRRAFATNT